MNSAMRICISSPPDRAKLAAEILVDDEQRAELNQEGGGLTLEIYPKHVGGTWHRF